MINLYIKRHKSTGLKYFGKTTKNPFDYLGSGLYWQRHLKTHGFDVETVAVYSFTNIEECRRFALEFSDCNNIVGSKEWANLKPENGVDGGTTQCSVETRQKIRASVLRNHGTRGKPMTEEHKAKISVALRQPKSAAAKQAMSLAKRGKIWITDGHYIRLHDPDSPVPSGWIKGRST